ncbi:MAG: hypothetical protein MZU84_01940 [Sphingobacterium sp.]|nr:hypothetical protein [Sphingobacterium sp.]
MEEAPKSEKPKKASDEGKVKKAKPEGGKSSKPAGEGKGEKKRAPRHRRRRRPAPSRPPKHPDVLSKEGTEPGASPPPGAAPLIDKVSRLLLLDLLFGGRFLHSQRGVADGLGLLRVFIGLGLELSQLLLEIGLLCRVGLLRHRELDLLHLQHALLRADLQGQDLLLLHFGLDLLPLGGVGRLARAGP